LRETGAATLSRRRGLSLLTLRLGLMVQSPPEVVR
jgi:hypothetical protein